MGWVVVEGERGGPQECGTDLNAMQFLVSATRSLANLVWEAGLSHLQKGRKHNLGVQVENQNV